MTGTQFKLAREERGWTQAEASRRLKVSQAYVSMLERERRPLPPGLLRRTLRVLAPPPLALPLPGPHHWESTSEDDFAQQLAALGYPGFAYLKNKAPSWNPAELLLAMLTRPELESRLVEALPWLAFRYAGLDWGWAVREAKLHDAQNRLGFVVSLAAALAEKKNDAAAASRLQAVLALLRNALLAKEDTLCHASLSQAERRWLRQHRPAEAAAWNLLSDMTVEHLEDAA